MEQVRPISEDKASMYFLLARPGQHLQSVTQGYLFPEEPETSAASRGG